MSRLLLPFLAPQKWCEHGQEAERRHSQTTSSNWWEGYSCHILSFSTVKPEKMREDAGAFMLMAFVLLSDCYGYWGFPCQEVAGYLPSDGQYWINPLFFFVLFLCISFPFFFKLLSLFHAAFWPCAVKEREWEGRHLPSTSRHWKFCHHRLPIFIHICLQTWLFNVAWESVISEKNVISLVITL